MKTTSLSFAHSAGVSALWDKNDMAMLEGPSEEVFSGIWPH